LPQSPQGTGSVVTVTVAVPDMLVFAVEMALTVSVAAVSFSAMISNPKIITVPALLLSVTSHVTNCDGLNCPVTSAVKVCVLPR